MLDILSDSELEKCELNLEAFMNDRVEILEQKLTENKLLKTMSYLQMIEDRRVKFEF